MNFEQIHLKEEEWILRLGIGSSVSGGICGPKEVLLKCLFVFGLGVFVRSANVLSNSLEIECFIVLPFSSCINLSPSLIGLFLLAMQVEQLHRVQYGQPCEQCEDAHDPPREGDLAICPAHPETELLVDFELDPA